jgi:hypothetical protein
VSFWHRCVVSAPPILTGNAPQISTAHSLVIAQSNLTVAPIYRKSSLFSFFTPPPDLYSRRLHWSLRLSKLALIAKRMNLP